MTAAEMRDSVDKVLSEGYRLWNESGIQSPMVSERYIAVDALALFYDSPNATQLAVACQCFYFFRKFHEMVLERPAWSTLLGDYFFSQFSKNIIPLDSVPLTDAFSAYLKNDIQSPEGINAYITFISGLPVVLKC